MNNILQVLKQVQWQKTIPFILVLIVFFYFQNQRHEDMRMMENLIIAIQDTTKHKIDSEGKPYAEQLQIRTNNPEVVIRYKTDDYETKRLQRELELYKKKLNEGSGITTFSTGINISTDLDVKHEADGSIITSKKDEWFSIENKFESTGKASSKLSVKNEYVIAQIEEDGKDVVIVKNNNPYDRTGEVRSFLKTKGNDKKVSLGLGLGWEPTNPEQIRPEIQIHYKILELF
jgi:PHD/YefM family antitoxin component YafN of YafNO toxin-antitoxin module